jgi:hypothetical protein
LEFFFQTTTQQLRIAMATIVDELPFSDSLCGGGSKAIVQTPLPTSTPLAYGPVARGPRSNLSVFWEAEPEHQDFILTHSKRIFQSISHALIVLPALQQNKTFRRAYPSATRGLPAASTVIVAR